MSNLLSLHFSKFMIFVVVSLVSKFITFHSLSVTQWFKLFCVILLLSNSSLHDEPISAHYFVFLVVGGISYYYMKNILVKLADLMILASGGKSNTYHVSCNDSVDGSLVT